MYRAHLINKAVIHLICFTGIKWSFTCCTENKGEPCNHSLTKLNICAKFAQNLWFVPNQLLTGLLMDSLLNY